MRGDDLDARAERLRALFEEKFRLKSRTLSRALRKAGRRLPRRHRRQVEALLEAQSRAKHPKLAVQIDAASVMKGCDEVAVYLKTLDPEKARRDRLLNLAALIAFYLLAVIIAFVYFLWWRGYV
ncbi:MAG: hypothetical protein HKN30_04525 [Sulfitobacter sp.]|nr:hypothetical protein [Sulfitobacter sp.]